MTTQPEPDRLNHLLDRLRRGVLLEAEAAQLATAVTMLLARLADQDGAADIAVRAIRLMNEAGVQRDAAEARIRELEAAAPEVDRRPLHARHVAALTDEEYRDWVADNVSTEAAEDYWYGEGAR